MPNYEYVCNTPQGKEVRGERIAKDPDDLAASLKAAGLVPKMWREKESGATKTVATRAFTKEVAGIMHQLNPSPKPKYTPAVKDRFQNVLLILLVGGSGVVLYLYLDSQIALLEQLNFQPHFVRQVRHHTNEIAE